MTSYSRKDIATLARTLYGEARGEPFIGKIAVGWVIRNRCETDIGNDGKPDWWGEGIDGVCHAPKQFSCWNANDPNLPKLLAVTADDPFFLECLAAAYAVLSGAMPDPTHGALHYFARSMPQPPKWAVGHTPSAVIGGHAFFRDVA